MATTKTDDELLADLAGLGKDDEDPGAATQKPAGAAAAAGDDEEVDHFAELRDLAARPNSTRPDTPVVSTVGKPTPTTSNGSGRSSEDKAADNQKILKAPAPPGSQSQQESDAGASASSWWGSISTMATSAMKQAEAAYKEIQKNEEAQKWTETMKGNVGALRDLGGDLRSRINFTSLLHTLAPPISQHERLQIHITHDLVGYPALDPLIYSTFSRVMAQVEGGDLLVIQRGSEFTGRQRKMSEIGYTGGTAGWNDGPWFRQNDTERNLNAVKGLAEGTKLARAAAESYAQEYFKAHGGIEEAARSATADLDESNPVRRSDIFLSIQAIEHSTDPALFGGETSTTPAPSAASTKPKDAADGVTVVDDVLSTNDGLISFALYLHDPVHSITFSSISQAVPQQWAAWLDARSTSATHDGAGFVARLPDEIAEIVDMGGVDPREWASEWMEETLNLVAGVVAQRYVARRMGVGEASLGRGRPRESAVESGGGEAARAI